MLLDLFVTHYNEPWEVGRPGFDMLRNQRCVDWDNVRVTLVHDGTDPFPDETFEGYPFPVRQVKLIHKGIAGTRNWCLDNAEAEWLKMNDFDDLFTSIYSLRSIMESLENAKDFDLMWFDVYADMDGCRYLKDQRDPVVLHGKVFRTKFLRDHRLRFREDLTWCEDSAFLAVMEMEIDHQRIGKIIGDSPLYTWIHRVGSLCNRPEILFDNLQSFFRRHCYVAEEFRKRGHMDEYNTMIARIMCDSYYTLVLAPVLQDKSKHEEMVYKYLTKHRAELLQVRAKAFEECIEATNRENENCHCTKAEVLAWWKAMREKYEGGEEECLT